MFCICIINDCSKPISCIPYIAYPISYTLYRIPKKFQNFKIFQNMIKFQKISKFSKNTCIIKGMDEIYDIINITCQNLYHMPYQPSTYITPPAGGPWGDIGFPGWYGM